jgi:hypothetical protein
MEGVNGLSALFKAGRLYMEPKAGVNSLSALFFKGKTYQAPLIGINGLSGNYASYIVKVVDESGNPLQGVSVVTANDENGDTTTGLTAANGEVYCNPFREFGAGNVITRYLNAIVTGSLAGYSTNSLSFTPIGTGGYFILVLALKAGMCTKLDGNIIVDDIERENQNDTCYCPIECAYKETVFTDGIGAKDWKNDKSSFLLRKITNTDTITFELWKEGSKLTDIVDNSFGTYYPLFPNQQLYTGLQLEWLKVWNSYGFGAYQVKASRNILGVADTYTSRSFRLLPYSDRAANNTIKIESFQSGNILSSKFDYTDLVDGGWYQSFRVSGTFGDKSPTLEQDNLLDQAYNVLQVQDKLRYEYMMDIRSVTAEIFNLVTEATLANVLLVTDFRIMAPEIFRRVSVVPVSFEGTTDLQNRRIRTIIKLTDAQQNDIKRNF